MQIWRPFKNQKVSHADHLQKQLKKMIHQQEKIEETISSLQDELLSIEDTCEEITAYLEFLDEGIESIK